MRNGRTMLTSGVGWLTERTIARATTSAFCCGPVGADTCPSFVRWTSKNSVRVLAGSTIVAVTPEPSSSPRSASVIPTSANFDAEYAPWNGNAIFPTTDPTFTICP